VCYTERVAVRLSVFICQRGEKVLKKSGNIRPLSGCKICGALEERGVRISLFEDIDSTNLEARRQAERGMSAPALIIADSQSAGRGRLGRSFYSPSGTGLYMSLLLGAKDNPADNVQLTAAAAVAAARSIEELCGVRPKIKWVNDLYLGEKKICGILCESFSCADGKRSVVIGIGVNLLTEDFPDELRDIAASVMVKGVCKEALAADISGRMLDYYDSPTEHGIMEYYRANSAVIGKRVVFSEGEKSCYGVAESIDEVGRLTIKLDDNSLKILSSGEISLKIDK